MIVALCGKKGVGKSTAANYLISNGWYEVSFAKILKDIVSIMFDLDRTLLDGESAAARHWRETTNLYWTDVFNENITPRILLQRVGCALKDNFHSELWCFILNKDISKILYDNKNANIVISDLRFPDEASFIKQIYPNCKILRIMRNTVSNDTHKSETMVDNIRYDEMYMNLFSKQNLYEWINSCI
jgi:hypothetical protein